MEQNQLKESALNDIKNLINNLDDKKAKIFCHWLKDYSKFLNYENQFDPAKLKKYKRGEIVKAHLGFNIGSEEGGLHYCVVLDNNNSKNNPVVTIAPMTSVKKGKDLSKLYPSELHIGSELYDLLILKANTSLEETDETIEIFKKIDTSNPAVLKDLDRLEKKAAMLHKILDEIEKLKYGSIILLGQITTISKIRIYDPKRNDDVLGKIKLSNKTLDLIDEKIKELFLKK